MDPFSYFSGFLEKERGVLPSYPAGGIPAMKPRRFGWSAISASSMELRSPVSFIVDK